MKAPRENDIVILITDEGEARAVVHTVLSTQFMVTYQGKDKFLLNKYEGIDWKHES